MPNAPRRACGRPGCSHLKPCPTHGARPLEPTSTERRKAAPYRRLYDRQSWRKASRAFLQGKVCAMCTAEGRVRMAQVTDHIRPHRGDTDLFWSRENWQPLCLGHHAAKTSGERE